MKQKRIKPKKKNKTVRINGQNRGTRPRSHNPFHTIGNKIKKKENKY